MDKPRLILARLMLAMFIAAMLLESARAFDLQQFEIDGIRIGDSQNAFTSRISRSFPDSTKHARRTAAASRLYTRPVSCQEERNGITHCRAKYAEMKETNEQRHFYAYRDLVAEFNQDRELAFLSVIATTRHDDKEACLKALSRFYRESVTTAAGKPSAIYPRNQFDIYYMKIDEQPFSTRMMGRLESAFSMVWQKERNDWSSFYSVDFGCRESGHMVVNTTLYDQAVKDGVKTVSSLGPQVTGFKAKD